MFKFFQGIATAITQKQLAKDQVLYSKSTGELFLDIEENNTVTRYVIRDPLMKELDGGTILLL